MTYTVTLIPGDGTGPELAQALETVIAATGVPIEWERARRRPGRDGGVRHAAAGARARVGAPQQGGHQRARSRRPSARAFAASTWRCARSSTCTPACGRPSRSRACAAATTDIDLVVVRENTEDLYAGIEHMVGEDAAESIKIITRKAQRAHRALRLRLCARPRPPQGHGRAQGQHHEVHRRPLPARRARGGRGATRTSSSRTASSTTCACSSCRSPSCTTCWCCPTSTATSSATCAPACRRPGRGARRQHRRRTLPCSSPCTAAPPSTPARTR